jgi:hypothetical protein
LVRFMHDMPAMKSHRWLSGFGRAVVGGALLLGALALWVFSGSLMRMLSAATILVFIGCDVGFVIGRGYRPLAVCGAILSALILSPIEISMFRRPGPPGVVPLIMGLPGPELRARARRGEVVLGGCITSGHEPRWVVVW